MSDVHFSDRILTIHSGKLKDPIAETYNQLKIRGSVTICQDVHVSRISSHGYSHFQSQVVTDELKNSGSTLIDGTCHAKIIHNVGTMKIKEGYATNVRSFGKLTVNESLQCARFDGKGSIRANQIETTQFRLSLSTKCIIHSLMSNSIVIEKNYKTISLRQKKLVCHSIRGRQLELINTEADIIEGEVVLIGPHCNIETLYYTDHYTIAASATVQQIIRRDRL